MYAIFNSKYTLLHSFDRYIIHAPHIVIHFFKNPEITDECLIITSNYEFHLIYSIFSFPQHYKKYKNKLSFDREMQTTVNIC